MPDRSKTSRRDPNEPAHPIFVESIGEAERTEPPWCRGFNARYLVVVVAAFVTAGIPSAFAQGDSLVFDVAAIHASRSFDPSKGLIDYSGTQLRATSVSLTALLKFAYQVRDHQIVGGPDWMKSATFDIDAGPIPAGTTGLSRSQRMLQSMLADRFALQLHRETRLQPIYRLVVSKVGSKMKAEDASVTGRFRPGRGSIDATAIPVSTLVTLIINEVGRTVTDETKLAGRYSFQLRFTSGLAAQPDSGDPSLFTALEEQLGLRLEPARGPVETLVIDHVEKPSEN
ncbi:MAG: hypothetical protein JWO19_3287 [Bryobacterales bacterium]|nr:hypothetical protein [Bryobacterales bacterium]